MNNRQLTLLNDVTGPYFQQRWSTYHSRDNEENVLRDYFVINFGSSGRLANVVQGALNCLGATSTHLSPSNTHFVRVPANFEMGKNRHGIESTFAELVKHDAIFNGMRQAQATKILSQQELAERLPKDRMDILLVIYDELTTQMSVISKNLPDAEVLRRDLASLFESVHPSIMKLVNTNQDAIFSQAVESDVNEGLRNELHTHYQNMAWNKKNYAKQPHSDLSLLKLMMRIQDWLKQSNYSMQPPLEDRIDATVIESLINQAYLQHAKEFLHLPTHLDLELADTSATVTSMKAAR